MVGKEFIDMRDPKSGLSHVSPHSIRWCGFDVPSTEQACRMAKFMWSSPSTVYRILYASTPLEAIKISRDSNARPRPYWGGLRMGIVSGICGSKLIQHPSVMEELLSTENLPIVLKTKDPYWGVGSDGRGLNIAGTIWEQWRDVLRNIKRK